MKSTLRILAGILTISSATALDAAAPTADPLFVPARGLILVQGNLTDVEAAIVEYDGLVREVKPESFRVELHAQGSGVIAVVLPDGLPAPDLANMTTWLSAPPGQEAVHGAVSWLVSPGTGLKYFLMPEASNPWGDTLLGATTHGQSIRVSLPEGAAMSEISASVAYRDEPEIEMSPRPVTIELTLDTDTGFGNPRFVVDSPRDHDWFRAWREKQLGD